MSTTKEESEIFHMAFNAGIASITQAMQEHDGVILKALVNASHAFALGQLSEALDAPSEDVALMMAPYVKPVQDMIDEVVREVG